MRSYPLTKSIIALGSYDTVISGGGIQGILAAAREARKGARVALLESRGSLGWEITRARQTMLPPDMDIVRDPTLEPFRAILLSSRTPDGQYLDSVACEVAFDEYMRQLGVDVFFLVRPIKIEARGNVLDIYLAAKEGIARLEAGNWVEARVMPKETGQSELFSFWNLILLNASVSELVYCEIKIKSGRVPVRLRPSPYVDEVWADIAYPVGRIYGSSPTELLFNRDLIKLFPKLQTACPGVGAAKLALVSDEPWIVAIDRSTNAEKGIWQQYTEEWSRLFH